VHPLVCIKVFCTVRRCQIRCKICSRIKSFVFIPGSNTVPCRIYITVSVSSGSTRLLIRTTGLLAERYSGKFLASIRIAFNTSSYAALFSLSIGYLVLFSLKQLVYWDVYVGIYFFKAAFASSRFARSAFTTSDFLTHLTFFGWRPIFAFLRHFEEQYCFFVPSFRTTLIPWGNS